MKKIMMTVAIVCAAALAQAAAVKNQFIATSTSVYMPGAEGVFDTTKTMKDNSQEFTMTVYYLASLAEAQKYATFDSNNKITGVKQEDVYKAYTDGEFSNLVGTKSNKTTLGQTTTYNDKVNVSQTATAGDYFAAVILEYTDANGKDWYIANVAELVNGGTANATVNDLANKFGGTTGAGNAITGWTAVPEPTSGLLLLLGVAGLALKRKRA